MEPQQYSLVMFLEAIKSEESKKTYLFHIESFRDYYNLKDFDSITEIEKSELQKMVETYVIHLKKEISPNSIKGYLTPIRTFLEINDIDLNWRKIKRLYPSKIKTSGSSAYSTEDVQKMLDSVTIIRNKAIVHFIASSGVRVGAIPDLKLKHIRDMPLGCKSVLVYEDTVEEYHTFLTPEASKSLDDYLNQRKKDNETLNQESPLFRETYRLGSAPVIPMTKKAIETMIERVLKKSNTRGQKKNGRYTNQTTHGFRKRFDTILKLNKDVNDNIIEKMLGHKKGLDGVYLQPTLEQMFNEFKNGIVDLTISDDHRNKIKLEQQKKKISELEEKERRIRELEKKSEYKDKEFERRLRMLERISLDRD